MTTPRGFRDKSEKSLLTLVGDIPELVRNLVMAEIDSAKKWLGKAAKNAGIGSGLMVGALFILFWSIPALGAFIIIGLSSWWQPWLAALVLFVAMLLIAIVLALLGYLRFRRIGKDNPASHIAEDVRVVKEAGE